jgi:tetratricopeptide (TPR) repeat protein
MCGGADVAADVGKSAADPSRARTSPDVDLGAVVASSDRHAAVLDELVEWWHDLSRREINSRAVLLPVLTRWGRTHLLNQFAAVVEEDEALSILVSVQGASLPDGLGLQAQGLQKLFSEARVEHRVAQLLGVDRLGGAAQLGLGVAGLFVSPLAALVGLLLAGVGVGAAGRVWDDSLAGQEGMVAKLARSVAAVSVSVPVVVTIDDADRLEPDLAVILVENLIERIDGQILVVAAVDPGGNLVSALTSRARYGLTEGRVRTVDADPGMDYQARVELIAELCPDLPVAAIRRIGQRTRTFAEVFAVAAAGRLAELDAHGDDAASVTVADEVIDAEVNRAPPSGHAVVLAWAGGVLHARQAYGAVTVLSPGRPGDDSDVIRFESLVRLTDPAFPRLAEQVRGLTTGERHRLAEILLDTAVEIGGDPQAGLVDKVVAWQAAHRVRADLQDRAQLLGVQCQVVHGLEDLGDPAAAYQVAETALAEYLASQVGEQHTPEHDDLSAAVFRLARTRKLTDNDPLIDATAAAAAAGCAAVGLEARIWAAIDLLSQPGERERAFELTRQITAELKDRKDLGAIGNRWRLQLAFHVGRAGYPAIAQQLLASMLNASGSPEDGDAARAVLYAVGGPGADTRLQIVGLEAELAALPPDADDDRLCVHHALAADYGNLGDYRRALHHGQQELLLRHRMRGIDHPDVLTTRSNIAAWSGECGHPAEALRLLHELLPDQGRVLGPDHPDTLRTRANIAAWTGRCGHLAEALRLYEELLPDHERVLGWDYPGTLMIRHNIATGTGQCGHAAEALRLFQELLPDQERVLGPDHPDTLRTRADTAAWTGECGHPAEALRLFQELLPDEERVLGPDHPDTLRTRASIAAWTGKCGHPAEALRLFRELLPDQERVLRPDHPETLTILNNIAAWTGECGHPAEALRLFQELLPDQERVLGPDHPDTLRVRGNIAFSTEKCGHPAEALRLYQELLPDQERVLGQHHSSVLNIRHHIQRLNTPSTSPDR